MRMLYPSEQRWIKLYRAEALTEQRGRCAYCKAPLPARQATADHLWPRKRYGQTSRENIVAACRPCNKAKGHKSEGQFYKLIKGRTPPRGAPPEILLIWASRRIWKRTHRACETITACVAQKVD